MAPACAYKRAGPCVPWLLLLLLLLLRAAAAARKEPPSTEPGAEPWFTAEPSSGASADTPCAPSSPRLPLCWNAASSNALLLPLVFVAEKPLPLPRSKLVPWPPPMPLPHGTRAAAAAVRAAAWRRAGSGRVARAAHAAVGAAKLPSPPGVDVLEGRPLPPLPMAAAP
jgi:hypothetical protein